MATSTRKAHRRYKNDDAFVFYFINKDETRQQVHLLKSCLKLMFLILNFMMCSVLKGFWQAKHSHEVFCRPLKNFYFKKPARGSDE